LNAPTLERRHFTISRVSEYFTPDGLQKETGQPPNQFRHMALKELIDNALDAAESAGNAPDVQVEFVETDNGLTLTIADNGPCIPADVVSRIVSNFADSTSDKAGYRSPMRGAQGNALKTVIGMPVALGADRSRLAITAAGIQHDIEVWVSPAGDARHTHHQLPAETAGTRITVQIPGSAECYSWNPTRWLTAFGLFNPHARLQIRKITPVWERQDEKEQPNLARTIRDQIRAAIAERIDLNAIAELAKSEVRIPVIADADLQAALDTNPAAPWREVVRQYADSTVDERMIANVKSSVIQVIKECLSNIRLAP
jgi:DNA topoisomerase VI subunit B